MNGYILNLVTCFDNRGFTKHYNAKVRLLFVYLSVSQLRINGTSLLESAMFTSPPRYNHFLE